LQKREDTKQKNLLKDQSKPSLEQKVGGVKLKTETKDTGGLVGGASAAEEWNKKSDFEKEIALEQAKISVEQTGKPQTLGDTYYYKNPKSGKVNTFSISEKKYATDKEELELEAKRYKADKDTENYLFTTQKQIKLLETYRDTLDPVVNSDKLVSIEGKLDDLKAIVKKPQGKGGKGRKIAIAFKKVQPTKIKLTSKKTSLPVLKLKKAPKIKKLRLKKLPKRATLKV